MIARQKQEEVLDYLCVCLTNIHLNTSQALQAQRRGCTKPKILFAISERLCLGIIRYANAEEKGNNFVGCPKAKPRSADVCCNGQSIKCQPPRSLREDAGGKEARLKRCASRLVCRLQAVSG